MARALYLSDTGQLVDDNGTPVPLSVFAPGVELPATPNAQDVVDALVSLGVATQAAE